MSSHAFNSTSGDVRDSNENASSVCRSAPLSDISSSVPIHNICHGSLWPFFKFACMRYLCVCVSESECILYNISILYIFLHRRGCESVCVGHSHLSGPSTHVKKGELIKLS